MKIKTLFALFGICFAFGFTSCNSVINPLGGKETPKLFPIRQNGKNGYINSKGEVVIQPQFAFTLPFSEGLAAVCIGSGKCGYIDETGNFAINPQFDSALRFSESLAAVVVGDKLGYIDRNGKYVINPQFTAAGRGPGRIDAFSTFSENLARVKISDKFGFIDKTGKIIINPQFEDAMPFFDGLAATKIGDKWGYIDKEGKIIINPQFEIAQPFINGLAAVLIGKQFGYIDKTGKIVINPQFDNALPFSDEGLAAVSLNQKMGFIDKDGKYVVNPQFGVTWWFGSLEEAFLVTSDLGRMSLSEGLTPVRIGDKERKFGYADETGKVIINPQFEEAFPFYGGLALVSINGGPDGTIAWIDKEGKIIWRETKPTPLPTPNLPMSNSNMNTAIITNSNVSNTTNNSIRDEPPPSPQRTGRLTTDSNLRSDANKDSASLGIHFKGAKITILDETSYTNDKGELSTWYKVRVTEYGCSVNANLGCGKNTANDADEGWVNAKVVLLD